MKPQIITNTAKPKYFKITGLIDDISKNYNLYFMILPAFIVIVLFAYFPMYGIIIAFKDYDLVMGFKDSPWVGFKHFISFVEGPYFFRLIRNTLLLGLYSLLWGFFPPILLALLLNEVKGTKFKKAVQSISYLPHFIAIVIVVGMMMEILGPMGLVNTLRNLLGSETINFFNEAKYFRTLYISSAIWQGVGWGSIVYLASLTGVQQELYEAAYIDGANRFQRAVHISLPCIFPVITILLILNAAKIINVGFEKVFLMYSPLIYEKADVISTYIYRRGIINRNFSFATAVGLMNSVISFIILYISNKVARYTKATSLW